MLQIILFMAHSTENSTYISYDERILEKVKIAHSDGRRTSTSCEIEVVFAI